MGRLYFVFLSWSSSPLLVNLLVEAFELYTRILGGKLPVHTLVTRITSLLPGSSFVVQCRHIWYPPIKALASEGTQLNFGHIEPTAVLRGMVDFQPSAQRLSQLRRKGLIE